ncbi:MAG: type II toxin-antitoxin system VapC family toxin [Bryobacteraceae bacterium]
MNVADSSAWLEALSLGPNALHFKQMLKENHSLIVPALVLYEVTKRFRVLQGEEFAKAVVALLSKSIYVEVTRAIALMAVELSLKHKLSTADSLIYATALEYDATLWTQDKHFKGLPSVKYFEKAA